MTEMIQNLQDSLSKISSALGFEIDPDAGKIFITGGNGPLGHRVATKLLRAGFPDLRLGAHRPEDMEDKSEKGAEVVRFVWEDPETYKKALDGVKTVFCTAPYHRGWKENFEPFLDACKDAGVQHIVKFSFYHAQSQADHFHLVPLVKDHGYCDHLLVKSGITFTILEATHLMSNPFVLRGNELRSSQKPAVLFGASRNKGVNYVGPNDIAECATRAILDPMRHKNRIYTLTGSSTITEQEVCGLLGDYLNKPVMYIEQPIQTLKDSEKKSGDPEWMIEDMVTLEMVKASGYEVDPGFATKDIENICGHPPETFSMYLQSSEFMSPVERAY